jgi:tRNA dimethylallyltransferase
MHGAVVICGPTASGKTELALALAELLDVEIISADSAQVYKGMDVGTAKPSPEILESVPHHLINIRDPADPYSAADFRADAERLVPEIAGRGKVPLIVGGTMLYLKALKDGLANLPEADASMRAEISQQAAHEGWESLHRELQQVDPEAASRIRPSDTQRLQRAIEVYRRTGIPLTALHREGARPCPFPLIEIAVMPADRATLHRVIEARFQAMLAHGFVEEVEQLHVRPDLHSGLPAIRAVGYRQIWSFLEGEIGRQEMMTKAVAATRQLAKRQITWLRRWQDLRQLESPDAGQALKILQDGTILD